MMKILGKSILLAKKERVFTSPMQLKDLKSTEIRLWKVADLFDTLQ